MLPPSSCALSVYHEPAWEGCLTTRGMLGAPVSRALLPRGPSSSDCDTPSLECLPANTSVSVAFQTLSCSCAQENPWQIKYISSHCVGPSPEPPVAAAGIPIMAIKRLPGKQRKLLCRACINQSTHHP